MEKQYTEPAMEIVALSAEDVVCTSIIDTPDNTTPNI